MGSMGFGLERIGILVLRAPKLSTVIVLTALAIAAAAIPGLRFHGNVIDIIDRSSASFERFESHVSEFRDSNNDVAVILRGKDLMNAGGLEAIRDLHLELALTDGIEQVISVFSLGDFSGSDGGFEPFLPDFFADDHQASEAISQLIRRVPSAALLIAPEENSALVIASLDADGDFSEADLRLKLHLLKEAIAATVPAELETVTAGVPAIRASFVDAIVSDQRRLTLVGILIGAIFSFLIFGNVRSAVICTLPSVIAVVWLLALFSVSGTKLNFITTVLPTLALIIALADSVVLYFRWQILNGKSDNQLENLKLAILRVGPASALTSVTTALAFFSFNFTSSEALQNFSLFGVGAVTVAFLAVITGLPLACYWSIRLGGKKGQRRGAWISLGNLLTWPARIRPLVAVVASAFLLAVLSAGHIMLKPSYNLSNNLPHGSKIRDAQDFLNRNFGGTTRIFVLVPVSADGTFADPENRKRITAIDDALKELLGAGQVVSLGGTWRQANPERIETIAEKLADIEPSVRARFLSRDARTMQVIVTVSSEQDTRRDAGIVAGIREALEKLGPSDDIVITGMRVLVSEEFPKLIDQLRQGLLIAVFLAVGIVILATRDWRLGLAALVPNLLPILIAELIILTTGNRLDITNVIALTIAFGIAIDNAVHIINGYSAESRTGKQADQAVLDAVREVGPALAASTAVLCVATVVTQFSPLPSVETLGRLLVMTLILALASNLTFLPAYIRLFGRAGAGGPRDRTESPAVTTDST